jgi:hypothetical protein
VPVPPPPGLWQHLAMMLAGELGRRVRFIIMAFSCLPTPLGWAAGGE